MADAVVADAVMADAVCRAHPLACREVQGGAEMPAGGTAVRAGVPRVDGDDGATLPRGLVGELTDQRPYQAALLMAGASAWVHPRCLTANASTQITRFSLIRRVASLWRPSARWPASLAGRRARQWRAFSRFLEPFCLRARAR